MCRSVLFTLKTQQKSLNQQKLIQSEWNTIQYISIVTKQYNKNIISSHDDLNYEQETIWQTYIITNISQLIR